VLPFSSALIGQLETADKTNTIVIVIVDPWTLNLQLYQECMRTYDTRNLVSCAVLVVWNPAEEQDKLTLYQLWQKVRETFPNSLTSQGIYIRETISSAGELSTELVAAMVAIRRRLDERAKLFHPIDPAGFAAVPQISTVSGAPPGNTP
jgi:FxsC-like protein